MIVTCTELVLLVLYFMQVKYNDSASQTVNPKVYIYSRRCNWLLQSVTV